MGRTSRCTGCKIPRSEHSFGKPGKNCTGPAQEVSDDSTDLGATAPKDQAVSSGKMNIQDTLVSLLGTVKNLSAGLDEVRADNQHLRALVEEKQEAEGGRTSPPPHQDGAGASAQISQPSGPVTTVTLSDLRAMANLSRKADRRVAQFGLADSRESRSDSDREDGDWHSRVSKKDKPSNAGKSLKSGKEAKITSTVLYPQSWPDCYLSITHGRRDVKYEELTLEEFVAGYGQILLSPDLSEVERCSRLQHLVSLMYFAQQYDWQAVLSFHGAVLLEIERGLLHWGDSFLHLECRTLYGHLKATKSSVSASSSASMPVLFCRDYQRNTCSFIQDHYGVLRGER